MLFKLLRFSANFPTRVLLIVHWSCYLNKKYRNLKHANQMFGLIMKDSLIWRFQALNQYLLHWQLHFNGANNFEPKSCKYSFPGPRLIPQLLWYILAIIKLLQFPNLCLHNCHRHEIEGLSRRKPCDFSLRPLQNPFFHVH